MLSESWKAIIRTNDLQFSECMYNREKWLLIHSGSMIEIFDEPRLPKYMLYNLVNGSYIIRALEKTVSRGMIKDLNDLKVVLVDEFWSTIICINYDKDKRCSTFLQDSPEESNKCRLFAKVENGRKMSTAFGKCSTCSNQEIEMYKSKISENIQSAVSKHIGNDGMTKTAPDEEKVDNNETEEPSNDIVEKEDDLALIVKSCDLLAEVDIKSDVIEMSPVKALSSFNPMKLQPNSTENDIGIAEENAKNERQKYAKYMFDKSDEKSGNSVHSIDNSYEEIAVSVSETAFGISEGSLGAAGNAVPCSQSVDIKLLELVDVLAGNPAQDVDVLAGNPAQDVDELAGNPAQDGDVLAGNPAQDGDVLASNSAQDVDVEGGTAATASTSVPESAAETSCLKSSEPSFDCKGGCEIRLEDASDCEDMKIIPARAAEKKEKRKRGRPRKIISEETLKNKRKLSDLTKKKISDNSKIFSICKVCNLQCKGFRGLVDHMHRDHPDYKPWTCSKCQNKFTFVKTLYRHLRTEHGVLDSACPYCSKKYTRAQSMLAHVTKHQTQSPHTFTCTICNARFFNKDKLDSHSKKKHSFSCHKCDKHFLKREDLKTHILAHWSEESTKCEECQENFNTSQNLRNHLQLTPSLLTDSEMSPNTCDICKKGFINVCSLKTHNKVIHTGLDENYPCDICSDHFRSKELYKQHYEKCHTESPKFACDVCGQRFGRRYHLKRHRNLHTTKGFPCDMCSRLFKREDGLKVHKLKAHKPKLDDSEVKQNSSNSGTNKVKIYQPVPVYPVYNPANMSANMSANLSANMSANISANLSATPNLSVPIHNPARLTVPMHTNSTSQQDILTQSHGSVGCKVWGDSGYPANSFPSSSHHLSQTYSGSIYSQQSYEQLPPVLTSWHSDQEHESGISANVSVSLSNSDIPASNSYIPNASILNGNTSSATGITKPILIGNTSIPSDNTSIPSSNLIVTTYNTSALTNNITVPSWSMSMQTSTMSVPSANIPITQWNTSVSPSNIISSGIMVAPPSNMNEPTDNMIIPSGDIFIPPGDIPASHGNTSCNMLTSTGNESIPVENNSRTAYEEFFTPSNAENPNANYSNQFNQFPPHIPPYNKDHVSQVSNNNLTCDAAGTNDFTPNTSAAFQRRASADIPLSAPSDFHRSPSALSKSSDFPPRTSPNFSPSNPAYFPPRTSTEFLPRPSASLPIRAFGGFLPSTSSSADFLQSASSNLLPGQPPDFQSNTAAANKMDSTHFLDGLQTESFGVCTPEAIGGHLSNADVQRELLLLPQNQIPENVPILKSHMCTPLVKESDMMRPEGSGHVQLTIVNKSQQTNQQQRRSVIMMNRTKKTTTTKITTTSIIST